MPKRDPLAEGEKPRFDWRSVYAGLAIWLAAVLCWVPVMIYGNHHSGEDMGGWFIASLTIVVSGVSVPGRNHVNGFWIMSLHVAQMDILTVRIRER